MTTAPKFEPTLGAELVPAEEPAKRFSDLVREHPGAFIAGGVVLGIALGALFPRSKAGASLGKRALALAATAGEIGLAASRQARDGVEKAAHDAKDRAGDLIDSDSAAAVREKAGHLASVAREVGQKAVDRASTLASRLKH